MKSHRASPLLSSPKNWKSAVYLVFVISYNAARGDKNVVVVVVPSSSSSSSSSSDAYLPFFGKVGECSGLRFPATVEGDAAFHFRSERKADADAEHLIHAESVRLARVDARVIGGNRWDFVGEDASVRRHENLQALVTNVGERNSRKSVTWSAVPFEILNKGAAAP